MDLEVQKVLSQVKQRKYTSDFPHVAPEILGGIRGQRDHFHKSKPGTLSCLASSGFERSPNKNAKFGHLTSSKISFSNVTTILFIILF